jgi:hypothetical protein
MTVGTQVLIVMVERETGEVETPAEVDLDTGGGTMVEAGALVLEYTGTEDEVTTG